MIAHRKGGAGKTTLAAHLAVAFAGRGRRVAVVDSDQQQSLADWHRRRVETLGGDGGVALTQVSEWRATTEMRRLRETYDMVVVDSPPHRELSARAGLRNADLAVVPVQPSPMDLWATEAMVELAAEQQTPVLVVLNRMPPRGRLSGEVAGIMAARALPLAATRLGNRQAFAASLMQGLGVAEFAPRSVAAAEIAALADEIAAGLGHVARSAA